MDGTVLHRASPTNSLPRLLHLGRPPFDSLSLTAHCNVQVQTLHPLGVLEEIMARHSSRVRTVHR